MRRWLGLLLWLIACGVASENEADVRRDVMLLQGVMGNDRTTALMEEAESAVSARKPVHAAALIQTGVLPTLDEQLAVMRAAELSTVTGRRLQLRAVDGYLKRREGLVLYQRVLADGVLESQALVDALHIQLTAETELLSLDAELDKLRPVPNAPAKKP